jgi:hypothetical protein
LPATAGFVAGFCGVDNGGQEDAAFEGAFGAQLLAGLDVGQSDGVAAIAE